MKADYLKELKQKRNDGDSDDIELHLIKNLGCTTLLSEALNKKLQLYLRGLMGAH